MGQPGIPMLNKVGYSMYWNSIWDNKILYSRLLKEDNFLNKFFNLAFNDSLSVNSINFKKSSIKINFKYSHIIDKKNSSIYKYLFNLNKVNYFSSKLWILKYHNWVILYQFIYIINFEKNLINSFKNINKYKNNFYYLLKYYNKSNLGVKQKLIFNQKNAKNNYIFI